MYNVTDTSLEHVGILESTAVSLRHQLPKESRLFKILTKNKALRLIAFMPFTVILFYNLFHTTAKCLWSWESPIDISNTNIETAIWGGAHFQERGVVCISPDVTLQYMRQPCFSRVLKYS